MSNNKNSNNTFSLIGALLTPNIKADAKVEIKSSLNKAIADLLDKKNDHKNDKDCKPDHKPKDPKDCKPDHKPQDPKDCKPDHKPQDPKDCKPNHKPKDCDPKPPACDNKPKDCNPKPPACDDKPKDCKPCEKPIAKDNSGTVYEAGLACGSDQSKTTKATGNLLSNDTLKGGATITEIKYEGKVYKAINGVITINSELGELKVYTKNAGEMKAGDYIYSLKDNACESGDFVKEVFQYTLQSNHCKDIKDYADLTIKIVDDAPKAENDPVACIMGCEKKVEGNVLCNDTKGADKNVKVISFTYDQGKHTANIDGNSKTVITEAGGKLTVNSDGTWCYESPKYPGGDCDPIMDGFKYTIQDCDGDKSSAEQPIKVLFPPPPEANDDCAVVYEAGLPCGTDGEKPTKATGNLLGNDNLKGEACISEVCFNGQTYKPTNGLILILSEYGELKVYTQDSGNMKAGDYIYSLKDNACEPGDLVKEVFKYTLESKDCCDVKDSADLTIKIIDDAPQAVDDPMACIMGCEKKIEGNVLCNDITGADKNVKVVSFTYDNGQHTANINGNSKTVMTDAGGRLTVNSDGSWCYESPKNSGDNCDPIMDGFKYTIEDCDGDRSCAEQPIKVLLPPPPEANDDCDIVYEAGLPCGTDGDKPTKATGNLLCNDDTKGGAKITEICFDGKTYAPAMNGVITVDTDAGLLKVYTKDGLNHKAGDYEYTLQNNVKHPDDAGKNIITEEFKYTLESKECCDQKDTANLTIKIVDDVPKAVDDCAVKVSKCNESVCGNVLTNDVKGADGPIRVTSFTYNNGANTAQIEAGGSTTVHTILGGLLMVSSDGKWEYTAPKNIDDKACDKNGDMKAQDGFSYKITDTDKDISQANQPIEVNLHREPPHQEPPCNPKPPCALPPVCDPHPKPKDCDDHRPRHDRDHRHDPKHCDDKPQHHQPEPKHTHQKGCDPMPKCDDKPHKGNDHNCKDICGNVFGDKDKHHKIESFKCLDEHHKLVECKAGCKIKSSCGEFSLSHDGDFCFKPKPGLCSFNEYIECKFKSHGKHDISCFSIHTDDVKPHDQQGPKWHDMGKDNYIVDMSDFMPGVKLNLHDMGLFKVEPKDNNNHHQQQSGYDLLSSLGACNSHCANSPSHPAPTLHCQPQPCAMIEHHVEQAHHEMTVVK